MLLYDYIIIYYTMLIYPVPNFHESQVKIIFRSKDGHNAHR